MYNNMDIAKQIIDQNPWWRRREAITQDKHLIKLKESSIKWEPRIKHTFNLNADIVYTLRGPRQVGKTTLLKLIIEELLIKYKVDPRSVLYFTCDLINYPEELVDILQYYNESIRPKREARAYIFLDEISSVKEWQKAIKYLSDTNKLVNTTIILTGSHTIDIKRAYERLPGRRGSLSHLNDTPDKIILPMRFVEYVETINKDLREVILRLDMLRVEHRKELVQEICSGTIPDEINDLSLYEKDIKPLFESYLITGGVPLAIDEYIRKGRISEDVYKIYVDSVVGDIVRWDKREIYLRQILRRIFETIGNAIGWNTLKENTDISSHNTIADYVDILKDSFVLYYVRFYDITRRKPLYQKNKKIHFYDPFFYHALKAWVYGKDPFEESMNSLKDTQVTGMLTEGIVGSHLIRLAFSIAKQKKLFDYEQALFYWKSKRGREVDFIIDISGLILPVEVKYQSKITKSDRYSIIDFHKSSGTDKGIILSKDMMELEGNNNIITLPVWLFLMLV